MNLRHIKTSTIMWQLIIVLQLPRKRLLQRFVITPWKPTLEVLQLVLLGLLLFTFYCCFDILEGLAAIQRNE
jgi:uncharacterized membrane protein YGL010W